MSIAQKIGWLAENQDPSGRFLDFITESGKSIKPRLVSYPRAVYIYGKEGSDEDKERTMRYMLGSYVPSSFDLEGLVEIMSGSL